MQKIPKRRDGTIKKQTNCVICNEKFDMVSAIFLPICNKCRENHKGKHQTK